MVIRHAVSRAAVGIVAAGLGVAVSGEAFAQANVLKECGSQYQAAKAANELAGRSWQDFLKECRTKLSEQAKEAAPAAEAKPVEAKPAEAAAPAPAPAAEAPAPLTPPPAAEAAPAEAKPEAAPAAEAKPAAKDTKAATQSRQKKCAAEWKAQKKELLKADKKLTWPKFWSSCNKRLKEAGE
ncbi:hypothetical protein LG047_05105 [Methylocystis sp. WRRC1]|uniref:hypothetical protein n=1 Tax=Methylocystis sp. WRRC1 TaxID=1732014 RepID=UPI001D15E1AE|nr:hypothetical protein [Methylocystis sp. WRRC1]MCC3244703.1 hypothetical protein [Methylocystis sp. WRRC1]